MTKSITSTLLHTAHNAAKADLSLRWTDSPADFPAKVGDTVYLRRCSSLVNRHDCGSSHHITWRAVTILRLRRDGITYMSPTGKVVTRGYDKFSMNPQEDEHETVSHTAGFCTGHRPASWEDAVAQHKKLLRKAPHMRGARLDREEVAYYLRNK